MNNNNNPPNVYYPIDGKNAYFYFVTGKGFFYNYSYISIETESPGFCSAVCCILIADRYHYQLLLHTPCCFHLGLMNGGEMNSSGLLKGVSAWLFAVFHVRCAQKSLLAVVPISSSLPKHLMKMETLWSPICSNGLLYSYQQPLSSLSSIWLVSLLEYPVRLTMIINHGVLSLACYFSLSGWLFIFIPSLRVSWDDKIEHLELLWYSQFC